MTVTESNILFNSANIKFELKEDIKILTKSRELKEDTKKDIVFLNTEISRAKKELFSILKQNADNTKQLIQLLEIYLLNNDHYNVRMILEHHLLFNNFSEEFYNKMLLLDDEEKRNFTSRLQNYIDTLSSVGLKTFAEILEDRLINGKMKLR